MPKLRKLLQEFWFNTKILEVVDVAVRVGVAVYKC